MNARKVLIFVVLVLVAVNLAIVAVVFMGGNKPSRPLPNPNGYDDFLRAEKMIGPNRAHNYNKMSREELASLCSSNAAALKLVHDGLRLECRVPPEGLPYGTNWNGAIQTQIYGLGHYLCAEGRLAELDGNTNAAAMDYLEALRFDQESSRGGVAKGRGWWREASANLRATMGGLNGGECREVARALVTVDAKAEPVQNYVIRTDRFIRSTATFRERIILIFKDQYAVPRRSYIDQFQTNVVDRRQMIIDFAARAYELEKGHPPQNVTELVPDYLKVVPKDPFTGKDMGLGH